MLKGFKEFLARGNIVDLSVAVVIGTAFTALVTKFTDSIIQPLIDRIGAGGDSDYGILRSASAVARPSTSTSCCRRPSTSSSSPRSSTSWSSCPTTGCARRAKSSRPRTPN